MGSGMIDKEETNVGAHALLVARGGKVILQQRDLSPGIVNPGLISMFGGTLKHSDDLNKGLKRELLEELELNTDNYPTKKLGVFYKTQDIDGVNWTVNVFIVDNVEPADVKVHEGRGYICDFPEELLKSDKLTRITRLALEKYILSK